VLLFGLVISSPTTSLDQSFGGKSMTRTLIVAALLAVGLMACGKEEQKPPPAAPAPAPAPAPSPAPPADVKPAPAPAPAPGAAEKKPEEKKMEEKKP
jgi:hypothetical protein